MHIGHVGLLALAVVALQGLIALLAFDHPRQRLAQADGIVDATVEPKTAQRVVHMRRIACEQHPALAKPHRDPLVHAVNALVHQGIGGALIGPGDAANRMLGIGPGQGLFFGGFGGHRQGHAPQTWRAFVGHFEQGAPLHRVAHICVLAVAQGGKVKGGAEHAVALGPGVAGKLDVGRFAHRAAPAIGTNQPLGGPFHHAIWALGLHHQVVALAVLRLKSVAKHHLDQTGAQHVLEHDGREPVLLQVQTVGIGRVVAQQIQIPFGHQAILQIARLPVPHRNPQRAHFSGHADAVQHLQGGRVKGPSPQVDGQARFGLNHPAGNALLRQHQGGDQTHRTGTHDHHRRPTAASHAKTFLGRQAVLSALK